MYYEFPPTYFSYCQKSRILKFVHLKEKVSKKATHDIIKLTLVFQVVFQLLLL